MKRSNSLPKSAFTAFNDKLRKEDSKKLVSYVRPKYRGRFSLNKNDTKESRRQLRQIVKDLGEEDEEGKMEPFRIYNCLPLSSEHSKEKVVEKVQREERKWSETAVDDRDNLFRRLKTMMNERGRNIHNVVVMAEHKLTFKAHNEDYAFGDVLWLILRARFHGNIDGSDDGAIQENLVVSNLRETKKGIMDRVERLRFDAPPLLDPFHPSDEYKQHVRRCRDMMENVLEEWWSFESLFPHSAGLLSACPPAAQIMPRITLLTAVHNTMRDLEEKLESLRILMGVEKEAWPSLSNSIQFEDVKERISEFVRKSLTLKGMSKILARVAHLCDASVAKAIQLLRLPPKSYAHAVMNKNKVDGAVASIHSDVANLMRIPTPLPLVVLMERIRLALLEAWLHTRADLFKVHDDSLTMETLIEDSRDCLQQAISFHHMVMDELSSTCVTLPPCTTCAFDRLQEQVFENYVWYMRMWVEAYSSEGRDTLHLFARIESELGKAMIIANDIPSASTRLFKTMIMVCTDLVRRCIVEEWQAETARVNEEAATYDLLEGKESEDDDDDEDCYMEDPSVLFTCRMYNSLLRSVQDRTTRVFAIIRRVIEQCKNGVVFEIKSNLETLSTELASYSMVEWSGGAVHGLSLLVDSQSVDAGRVDELIVCMGEGKKVEEGEIILCPALPFWHGRTVRAKCDMDDILRFAIPLVTDSTHLLICGRVHGRLRGMVKTREGISLCSHEVLNQELIHFSKEILELSETLHSFVTQLSGTYSFAELFPHHIPPFRFTMTRAFDLCMHVYRELSRMLVHSQLETYVLASTNLIRDWRHFLEQSRPHPSKDIPLWAMPALTFIQTVSHPCFTRLLPDQVFSRMSADISACIDLITRSDAKEHLKGEVVSPRTKKESRDENMKREEKMAIIANNMDKYVEERIRRVFVLGTEVVKSREEYTVKNYIDPYRRAVPFKWRMLEQIGKGSFGIVHKAVREDGNGLLAVKIIKVQRELISVLESEVAVMRDLKHGNLVTYFGAEVRGDEVVILMEYCSEGTLEDICVEGMDTALVRKCTHSLLQAVSFIHAHHVVHRDIKPANIFLSRSSVLKLGDFGCARRLRGTDTAVGELKQHAGTLNYMAPELLNYGGEIGGEKGVYRGYGRAIDIWSVGCVVIHMLTGHVPWEGYQWYQIVLNVGKGERPSYAKAGETKIVSNFLDDCFHYDPEERLNAEMLLKRPFANVQGLLYEDNDGSPNSTL
ncbi:hypothetical protein PFISCL1PPCAC_9084 [Pristionchus fissidentatus]|uniref:Protein kinase domain-containing protein n=1 Tax=Pristionchus fissidentatus TaxID=1538716 RepID=A0AAV5VI64_9BILA|nr:hypothetical protein PFISCL1PPCAC_9084 [Pristionchus fissidentatus]